jgi:hypothetical protein
MLTSKEIESRRLRAWQEEIRTERLVTSEQIKATCEEIQAGWSPEEEEHRRRPYTVGGCLFPGARLDGDLRATSSDVSWPCVDRSGLIAIRENHFDDVVRSYEEIYE